MSVEDQKQLSTASGSVVVTTGQSSGQRHTGKMADTKRNGIVYGGTLLLDDEWPDGVFVQIQDQNKIRFLSLVHAVECSVPMVEWTAMQTFCSETEVGGTTMRCFDFVDLALTCLASWFTNFDHETMLVDVECVPDPFMDKTPRVVATVTSGSPWLLIVAESNLKWRDVSEFKRK